MQALNSLVHLLQKELERQMVKFEKERQQFQTQIAAEERAKRAHQVLCVNVSECIATWMCMRSYLL